jgi:hypothetical protein
MVSQEPTGFYPSSHTGEILVATVKKAKKPETLEAFIKRVYLQRIGRPPSPQAKRVNA